MSSCDYTLVNKIILEAFQLENRKQGMTDSLVSSFPRADMCTLVLFSTN